MRDSGGGSGSLAVALRKDVNEKLSLVFLSNQSVSSTDKSFRISFDLLIDNE